MSARTWFEGYLRRIIRDEIATHSRESAARLDSGPNVMSPDSHRPRFRGLRLDDDSYGYPWDEDNPVRSTLDLDLDEATFLGLKSILDARDQGVNVRIITQPDLVTAVDELLRAHDSSSQSVQDGGYRPGSDSTVEAAPRKAGQTGAGKSSSAGTPRLP